MGPIFCAFQTSPSLTEISFVSKSAPKINKRNERSPSKKLSPPARHSENYHPIIFLNRQETQQKNNPNKEFVIFSPPPISVIY